MIRVSRIALRVVAIVLAALGWGLSIREALAPMPSPPPLEHPANI